MPAASARAETTLTCWGEIVWDGFVEPETRETLGGCGAAVAAQLAAQGAQVRLISAVGDDEAGALARAELERRGIDTRELQTLPGVATARVRIRIGAEGQPVYSVDHRLEWGSVAFEAALLRASRGSDALLFSRFAQHAALDLAPLATLAREHPALFVGCDLNLRRPVAEAALAPVAGACQLVKMNQAELELARAALGGEDPPSWFLARGRTRVVAVTRGAAGATLYTPEGRLERAPAPGLDVQDAVGAGDAFFAGLALALLDGANAEAALGRGLELAELQIARRGALPAPDVRSS